MLMISVCNWNSGVEIFEFEEAYDPEYLNLDLHDESSWKIYAEKVRDVMAKCLELPKVENGFEGLDEVSSLL